MPPLAQRETEFRSAGQEAKQETSTIVHLSVFGKRLECRRRPRPDRLPALAAQWRRVAPVPQRLVERSANSFSQRACLMPQSGGGARRRRRLVWRHEQSMVQSRRQSLGHRTQSAQDVASEQSAPHAGRPALEQNESGLAATGGAGCVCSRPKNVLAVCVRSLHARAAPATPRHGSTLTTMATIDPRYPLGIPLNRPAAPSLRPISGRPNWFVDSRGVERYLEHPAQQPAHR